MLRKRIKMMLIKLGLVFILVVSLFKVGNMLGNMDNKTVYASNMNTYKIEQIVNKEVKSIEKVQNKGRILIYNSHSCEKNQDSSITQISSDLKLKLEKKGFVVEQNLTDFARLQGYNKSYHSSGNWLKSIDLSQYVLTIDLHMDGTQNPVNTKFNENNVARIMFPNVSENPNLKHQTQLVDKIKSGLESFSNNIYKSQTTSYRQGIIYYNLDKNPNILLIEVGSDKNTFVECQRSMTLLSSAIERALSK
jgi:stage II sporulation protein P